MVVSNLPPGTAWATGDATKLVTSATLWPLVSPFLSEEKQAIYGQVPDVNHVFTPFWWMGDAAESGRGIALNLNARLSQMDNGTLRDPEVRYKCVCPMTDCTFVVPAYTNILLLVMEVKRTIRVAPRTATEEQVEVINQQNLADGGGNRTRPVRRTSDGAQEETEQVPKGKRPAHLH